MNDKCQCTSHGCGIFVLEYITPYRNPASACINCSANHFEELFISIGLWASCHNDRRWAAFHYSPESINIASVIGLYDICTQFSACSCYMGIAISGIPQASHCSATEPSFCSWSASVSEPMLI